MKKQDQIFGFFNSQFPFNQEGLKEFAEAFKIKKVAKGTLISSEGDTENELRFLIKGTVREFFSHQGKEMNTQFFVNPQFITDFHSLISDAKRKKYQESLSSVELKTMDKNLFLDFMDRYQCGKGFVDEIFKKLIAEKEDEAFKHFSLTPDELYQDLLTHRPQWLRQVPLYHIATYLRMTPETLSRIRKRS